MEHSRKQKLFVILILFVAIASLSVGFAAFSMSLNVSSSASVTPNSSDFSIKFSKEQDSVVVDDLMPLVLGRGATATYGVIVNNGSSPTLSNLAATFTAPGQMAKYYVYVRNEGIYTAYLNSINFIGSKTCVAEPDTSDELVQSACDDITLKVTVGETVYMETESISNHPLDTTSWEKVLVELYYDSNSTYVDGPFSINFPNVSLVYSTVDDPSIEPDIVRLESGDLNTPGSVVAIGNEKFYVFGQENGNVKLLSMYNLHVGNFVDTESGVRPMTSPTGIQDSTAKSYVENELPYIGTTAFSNIGTAYSGSIVEEYVNNYKIYLVNIGADVSAARLITYEELQSFGCSGDAGQCNSDPGWIYSTSYWTGSAYDATTGVIGVLSNSKLVRGNYRKDRELGVRPVIEIPLSEFE